MARHTRVTRKESACPTQGLKLSKCTKQEASFGQSGQCRVRLRFGMLLVVRRIPAVHAGLGRDVAAQPFQPVRIFCSMPPRTVRRSSRQRSLRANWAPGLTAKAVLDAATVARISRVAF